MRTYRNATIQWGLVGIEGAVCTGTSKDDDDHTGLVRLHKTSLTPIHREEYDDKQNRVLSSEDTVKAAYSPEGKPVVIPVETLDIPKKKNLVIEDFVAADAIDPLLSEGFYYFQAKPGDDGAATRLQLLRLAMLETESVAVSQWTPASKTVLVVIRPYHEAMIVQRLFYKDEVREPDEDALRHSKIEVDPSDLKDAVFLIKRRRHKRFEYDKYRDEQAAKVKELIAMHLKGLRPRKPAAKHVEGKSLRDALQAMKEEG